MCVRACIRVCVCVCGLQCARARACVYMCVCFKGMGRGRSEGNPKLPITKRLFMSLCFGFVVVEQSIKQSRGGGGGGGGSVRKSQQKMADSEGPRRRPAGNHGKSIQRMALADPRDGPPLRALPAGR